MRVPIRTCVACRQSAGKRELIRLVVTQDAIQVDPSGSRPGRGAYLCALSGCVNAALRRDGVAIRRALRLGRTPESDQRLRADQRLQHNQGRVTLDIDALRVRLGEVEDAKPRRRDERRDKRGSDAAGWEDSPSPQVARE